MADGLRLTADGAGRAWLALAALAGFFSLLAWPLPHASIEWQPDLAAAAPWRAVTAAFVHYSLLHLLANLAGAALVAALGYMARADARCAAAWLAAWPLTQLGLLMQPELHRYGGLSGVLHAGVAVVAVHLLFAGGRTERRIAAAIALGLGCKIMLEAPWSHVLRHPAGWDIAVAPLAHASGAVAGALCAAIVETTRPLGRESG